MDLLIAITALLYLIGISLAALKGYGQQRISDELRHRIINIAFIWHTLLIILMTLQFQNYFFVVPPYNQIVIAWVVVVVYLLWTKAVNQLILELYVLASAFLIIFPLVFVKKVSPEIVSNLWLQNGGLIQHIFLVTALGLILNTVLLDMTHTERKEFDKNIFNGYLRGLILWVVALGFYYYWSFAITTQTGTDLKQISPIWTLALTLFLVLTLYYQKVKEDKLTNKYKVLKILATFILVSLFAVTFGL